ncbi:hypothetical protein PLCT1_01974 [Planctomycetaceae bacterium]|nr:hypothetical protein PLCT1_01974 [Planctomycetaceae bacterium]
MTTPFEYDICLSFAGEDRNFVRQVADLLTGWGVRVFFDEYEEAALWGKDLYVHLSGVYGHASRYCVTFISVHYAAKLWTNHERQSAQSRAFREHSEYILPARFDDTTIPGIPETVGYIDLRNKTPETFSRLILEKLGHSQPPEQPPAGTAPSGTILVVDDDFSIIASLFSPLIGAGLRLLTAQNVAGALDIIYSDVPLTAVVCDLIMPFGTELAGDTRHTGILVIEALRRVRPDVKVACLSVVRNPDVLARVRSLGVDLVLTKPILPSELRAAILSLLETPSRLQQHELLEAEVARCVAALENADARGRIRAAWALGELGRDQPTVVPRLERALSLEADLNVRRALVDALGKLRMLG